MADGARGGLILVKAVVQAARHFSPMVTRFPTGREPHKPAAAPVLTPAPAPAPKSAEEAKPKRDGCCCGGSCGGEGKAKS